jgi:membrane-associated phospholipid phosphatase
MISGCAMAAIRVVGGVHWPRDVIAGAACALVLAAIGYAVIPW